MHVVGELLPSCYGSLRRPDIMRVPQEGIPMGLLCLSGGLWGGASLRTRGHRQRGWGRMGDEGVECQAREGEQRKKE